MIVHDYPYTYTDVRIIPRSAKFVNTAGEQRAYFVLYRLPRHNGLIDVSKSIIIDNRHNPIYEVEIIQYKNYTEWEYIR